MPIRVAFSIADELQWTEETSPLIVNAHGGLMLLSKEVQVGHDLALSDVPTDQRRQCRVVMIGTRPANMNEVAVELLEPFNDCWRVLDPAKGWAQFREAGKRGDGGSADETESLEDSLAQQEANHAFRKGTVGRPQECERAEATLYENAFFL